MLTMFVTIEGTLAGVLGVLTGLKGSVLRCQPHMRSGLLVSVGYTLGVVACLSSGRTSCAVAT